MINAEGMSATLRAVIMMNGANLHASRKGDGFSQIPPALQARVNGRHFWHYCPSVVALGIAELDGLDPQGGNTTIMDAGYREIPHPKMLCTEHKRAPSRHSKHQLRAEILHPPEAYPIY